MTSACLINLLLKEILLNTCHLKPEQTALFEAYKFSEYYDLWSTNRLWVLYFMTFELEGKWLPTCWTFSRKPCGLLRGPFRWWSRRTFSLHRRFSKKNVPQFIQNDHHLKLSVARDLKMMLGSPVVKKITNNESATAQISGFLSRSL